MRVSGPSATQVLLLLGALALPVYGHGAGKPETDPGKLKEVDFSGLSEAQKKTALKVMNEGGCNCGCQMTIASCRERDSSCRRSLIFAEPIGRVLVHVGHLRQLELHGVDAIGRPAIGAGDVAALEAAVQHRGPAFQDL